MVHVRGFMNPPGLRRLGPARHPPGRYGLIDYKGQLGLRSAADQRHDPVADGEPGDARPRRRPPPAISRPGTSCGHPGGRRVVARPLGDVRAVHSGRADRHDHLVVTRHGVRALLPMELLSSITTAYMYDLLVGRVLPVGAESAPPGVTPPSQRRGGPTDKADRERTRNEPQAEGPPAAEGQPGEDAFRPRPPRERFAAYMRRSASRSSVSTSSGAAVCVPALADRRGAPPAVTLRARERGRDLPVDPPAPSASVSGIRTTNSSPP